MCILLLCCAAIRGEKISRKVDVYSFAIIMWETQTLRFPFDDSEANFPFSYQFAQAIATEGLRPTLVKQEGLPGELPRSFVTLMVGRTTMSVFVEVRIVAIIADVVVVSFVRLEAGPTIPKFGLRSWSSCSICI